MMSGKKQLDYVLVYSLMVSLNELNQRLKAESSADGHKMRPDHWDELQRAIAGNAAKISIYKELLSLALLPRSAQCVVTETLKKIGFEGEELEMELATIFRDAEDTDDMV